MSPKKDWTPDVVEGVKVHHGSGYGGLNLSDVPQEESVTKTGLRLDLSKRQVTTFLGIVVSVVGIVSAAVLHDPTPKQPQGQTHVFSDPSHVSIETQLATHEAEIAAMKALLGRIERQGDRLEGKVDSLGSDVNDVKVGIARIRSAQRSN